MHLTAGRMHHLPVEEMEPGVQNLIVASDLIIAVAYGWIPIMLALFLRKRWIDFHLRIRGIIGLFTAFILACGSTHFLNVLVMLHGETVSLARVSAALKLITAAVSAGTAALMFWVMPVVLHIPIELEREKQHRTELEREITSRRSAELALQKQLKHAAVLRHITDTVRGSLDAPRIFEGSAREIGAAFGADVCAIWTATKDLAGPDEEESAAGLASAASSPPASAARLPAGPPLRCVAVYTGGGAPAEECTPAAAAAPPRGLARPTSVPDLLAAAGCGPRAGARLGGGRGSRSGSPVGGIGASLGGGLRRGLLAASARGYAPLATAEAPEAPGGPGVPVLGGWSAEDDCGSGSTRSGSLRLGGGEGPRPPLLATDRGVEAFPIVRQALQTDDILEVPDVRQDPHHACYAFFDEMRAGSAVVVRTSFAGQANGVILLARRRTSQRLDGDESELLSAAAQQIGIALEQARMLARERRVNAALQRARVAADEANAAKSRFIASMSHEIRTPLNAVIGFTSVLLQYGDSGGAAYRLSPEQGDMLETIKSSGETLLTIINDILDFSKLDAHKMELEARPFSTATIIEECLEIIATEAGRKGLGLTWALEASVPTAVVGDPTRLKQILLNLCSNAAKFTKQGSISVLCSLLDAGPDEATLAEEPEPEPEPEPARPASRGRTSTSTPLPAECGEGPLAPGDLRLRFDVADTGCGIPPERMDRLFLPFSQADSSITRQYGGTGLGLAISRKLAEHMRGRIWADPRPGAGTTFSFTVVVRAAPPAAPASGPSSRRSSLAELPPPLNASRRNSLAAPSGPPPSRAGSEAGEADEEALRGRRVAVASPCPVERRFFEVELGRVGAACAAAASLLEAVAAGGPPDLVVVDAREAEELGAEALAGLPGGPPALILHPPGVPTLNKDGARGPLHFTRPLRRAHLFRLARRALLPPPDAVAMERPSPASRSTRSLSAPNALELAAPARPGPPASAGPTLLAMRSASATPSPPAAPLLLPLECSAAPPYFEAAAPALLEAPPAAATSTSPPEAAPPAEEPPAPPRILVAEDNLVNQKVVSRLLAVVHGAQGVAGLLCVPNGQEAVAALARQPFDLVFMDVQMPVMDGMEATRQIRASAAIRQPYIVALTANVSEEDRRGCLASGMNAFLRKPLRVEELRDALAAFHAARPAPRPGGGP